MQTRHKALLAVAVVAEVVAHTPQEEEVLAVLETKDITVAISLMLLMAVVVAEVWVVLELTL
jgi:hypothetical protein